MAPEIISRAEARARGLKRYFTGKTCSKSHIEPRFVSSGACIVCAALRFNDWNSRNREKRLAFHRKYHAEHAEERNNKSREYYKANAEPLKAGARIRAAERWKKDRDRVLEDGRKWRSENIEQVREAGRKSSAKLRKEHPELTAFRIARWAKKNPEKIRKYNRNRRAMRMGAEGSHTLADLAEIRKMQKNRCAYCVIKFSKTVRPSLDHIIALVNGGSEDRKNLQYLCASCNSKKSDLDPVEYAKKSGRLI